MRRWRNRRTATPGRSAGTGPSSQHLIPRPSYHRRWGRAVTRGYPEMLPDGAPPVEQGERPADGLHRLERVRRASRRRERPGRAAPPGISAALAITPRIRVPGRPTGGGRRWPAVCSVPPAVPAIGSALLREGRFGDTTGTTGIRVQVRQLAGLDPTPFDTVLNVLAADLHRRAHGLEPAVVDKPVDRADGQVDVPGSRLRIEPLVVVGHAPNGSPRRADKKWPCASHARRRTSRSDRPQQTSSSAPGHQLSGKRP